MTNGHFTSRMFTPVLAGLCVLVSLTTCSQKASSPEAVVAEVGGRRIKMREVTDYITSLAVHYPTAAAEYEVRKGRLDRLIEDELLVIGGYTRTLDADIGILELVDREKDQFLLDELYRTEVIGKTKVDEQEVRASYEHWFDRVQFKHIVVKEKQLADSLYSAIQAGAHFGDLADRFSIDQASRFRGGDPGREYAWNDLPPQLVETVSKLEGDNLGGPVETEMGWHILRLVGKRSLEKREFESVRPSIEAILMRQKQQKRREAHLAELQKKNNFQYDQATLGLWREKLQAIMDTSTMSRDRLPAVPAMSLTRQEQERVIYTFGADYKVGLGEFCAALESHSPFERPDPANGDHLQRFAFQNSLYDVLREEALRQGLDESTIYKERVQEYLEKLIADKMRNTVLVRGISVSESDMKEYYQAYPDSFVEPAAYHVREIMVFKEDEANRLANQLRRGANFEVLARQHTKRAGLQAKGGDLGWVSPTAWPDFVEPASRLRPGEWTGPVPAIDQYSLLQLIESRPAKPLTYEEVANSLFDRLQRMRRDSIFAEYVDSMRVLYPVTVNENMLKSGLTDTQGGLDSAGVG